MKIKYMALSFALIAGINLKAQEFHSTYFLEGATYRHQMNPSFMGERGYVAIPVLGKFNIGLQGNIGVSNFLYKCNHPDYSLTTFMSPTVSASDFLGSLHKTNELNFNLSMPVISFGFHKWGGFNTFSLNTKANLNMNLPYELFEFMKVGQLGGQVTEYDFKDLTLRANAYAELALGHARPINENLTVGGKLKFLVGGANVNAFIEEASISMSEDVWKVNMRGQADAAINGIQWKTKAVDVEYAEQREMRQKIEDVEFNFNGLNGFGLGIDLGATYKMDDFVDGLTLSASLLDLGFIRWKKNINAYNDGKVPFNFEGFDNLQLMEDETSTNGSKDIDEQWNEMQDDLEALAQFYDGGMASRTSALNATLHIGAEYEFPLYKKLSFAFLFSSHFNKPFSWAEGRFYANVAPVKWFDVSVNYGASKYGSSFGWVLNFHPKGFNFFIGSDHMMFKVTPQFVPVHNLNANLNIGFNVTFGKGLKKSA